MIITIVNAKIDKMEFKNLYSEKESFIVRKLLEGPHVIDNLLKQLEINFPYCWAITNIKSDNLLPDWGEKTPGDIDIIAGNIKIKEETWDFDNLLAIQVKVRRVTLNDKLKSFACGIGKEQSIGTLEMGFDRVFLLHVLVRDPKEFGPEDHPNAPWILNSDFSEFEKANENLIIEYFKNNEQTFGYGWLAWGQVYGRNFWESGGSNYKILYNPPINRKINYENRRIIVEHLHEILNNDKSRILPIVIHK